MRKNAANDEITAARRKKRRRYLLKQAAVFLAVLACATLILVAVKNTTPTTLDDLSNYISAGLQIVDKYPSGLSGYRVEEIKTLGIGYATLSEKEAAAFGSNGARMLEYPHNYAFPTLKTGNMRALLFGRASRELVVFNHSGVVHKLTTDFPVIDADISGNGAVAALTESDRYTAQLVVYEKGAYAKQLTWYEAQGFPLSVTLSEDAATAAVVSVLSKNSAAASEITLIDVKSAKETAVLETNGVIIRVLLRNNRVTAITDTGVVSFDMNGNTLNEYKFGSLPLLELAYDEGAFLAIAFGDNDRSAVNEIVVLSSELGEAAVITGVGTVKDIYLARDRLYVLGDGRAAVYSALGEPLKEYETGSGASAIFVKRGLIALYPNRLEKID